MYRWGTFLALSAMRAVVCIAYTGFLVGGYRFGVWLGRIITDFDYWFVDVTMGIAGVGLMLWVTLWMRNALLCIFNYAGIYSVVNGTGVLVSLAGCIGRFTTIAGVWFFNKVLRAGIKELFYTIREKAKLGELTEFFSQFKDSKIVKATQKMLGMCIDCADECVLAYCFKYQEPLAKSASKALVLFVKNGLSLIAKTTTMYLICTGIRIVFYVMAALVIFRYGTISNIVIYLVVTKGLASTLEESFLQPLLLQGVIKTFSKLEDPVQEEEFDHIAEISPAMEKVRGVNL